MRGLLKNNFYSVTGNTIMVFLAFIIASIALLITGNATLLIIIACVSPAAFSFMAMAGIRKEAESKWNKYELTTPVRRKDIIKGRFFTCLIWSIAGLLLTGILTALAVLIHGNKFFYWGLRDALSMFSIGIGIAFLMGALFYPLIYWLGAGKSEAVQIISLLGAIALTFSFTWLVNSFNDFSKFDNAAYYIRLAIFIFIVISLFVASYFLTFAIYKNKEY